jgi:regulator of sirC expression with transglutaminase-like and TPR domain
MGEMIDPASALAAIGALGDDEIDLAGAAIQFARAADPQVDPRPALAHLSELARAAAALTDGGTAVARAEALAHLLATTHGYRGDEQDYDDLANADLIQVIARRRGLPVTLGILWLHAAAAAGWPAWGLDMPGHFLLAIDGKQGPVMVDAFDRGQVVCGSHLHERFARLPGLGGARALTPMAPRAVLLRLQNNIRTRRERAGDLDGAIACLDLMLKIAPTQIALWQDAAELNQRLGRIAAAMRCLGEVLKLAPAATTTARAARARLDELRTHLS